MTLHVWCMHAFLCARSIFWPCAFLCYATRQCDRVAKVMDSKSIGLCPQGLKSPRCRIGLPFCHAIPTKPGALGQVETHGQIHLARTELATFSV